MKTIRPEQYEHPSDFLESWVRVTNGDEPLPVTTLWETAYMSPNRCKYVRINDTVRPGPHRVRSHGISEAFVWELIEVGDYAGAAQHLYDWSDTMSRIIGLGDDRLDAVVTHKLSSSCRLRFLDPEAQALNDKGHGDYGWNWHVAHLRCRRSVVRERGFEPAMAKGE